MNSMRCKIERERERERETVREVLCCVQTHSPDKTFKEEQEEEEEEAKEATKNKVRYEEP